MKRLQVSWERFKSLCDDLKNKVEHIEKKRNNEFVGIFGIPRGGSYVALELSHTIGKPILNEPKEGCLVVDDIADSGSTIRPYFENEKYFVATLFKRITCPITVEFVELVRNEWVIFPYEIKELPVEENAKRLLQSLNIFDSKRYFLIHEPDTKKVVIEYET